VKPLQRQAASALQRPSRGLSVVVTAEQAADWAPRTLDVFSEDVEICDALWRFPVSDL